MWGIDQEKKREFLEKSMKTGTKALKVAEDSDIPTVIGIVLHVLSKTLETRASMESDRDVKRSLLEKALRYRERNIRIAEGLTPFDYFNLGVLQNYLAEIKAELGYLEPELNSKRALLEEAASYKEKCLRLITKQLKYGEKMGPARASAR